MERREKIPSSRCHCRKADEAQRLVASHKKQERDKLEEAKREEDVFEKMNQEVHRETVLAVVNESCSGRCSTR